MIPDFKTYIGESVWGKVLDRGAGEIIRKEDDVNHLDIDEFYDYLNQIYVTLPKHLQIAETFLLKIPKTDTLSILLLTDMNDVYRLKMEKFSEDDRYITFPITRNILEDKLYKKLKDNYSIEIIESKIIINPKTGNVTNSFFIELIDFIITNTEHLTKQIARK